MSKKYIAGLARGIRLGSYCIRHWVSSVSPKGMIIFSLRGGIGSDWKNHWVPPAVYYRFVQLTKMVGCRMLRVNWSPDENLKFRCLPWIFKIIPSEVYCHTHPIIVSPRTSKCSCFFGCAGSNGNSIYVLTVLSRSALMLWCLSTAFWAVYRKWWIFNGIHFEIGFSRTENLDLFMLHNFKRTNQYWMPKKLKKVEEKQSKQFASLRSPFERKPTCHPCWDRCSLQVYR